MKESCEPPGWGGARYGRFQNPSTSSDQTYPIPASLDDPGTIWADIGPNQACFRAMGKSRPNPADVGPKWSILSLAEFGPNLAVDPGPILAHSGPTLSECCTALEIKYFPNA